MKSSLRYAPLSKDQTGKGIEECYEDLFNNAPCGYISLTPDSHIAMVNNTVSAWTGYSRENLIGKRVHDVLQFSSGVFLETHIRPLLRMQGFVDEVALDFKTARDDKLPTLASATERRDAVGSHISTRLILLKAIDRRKYERELVVARDQAMDAAAVERQTSEFREQFIAVLGHDLRNPLASIIGGTRMLGKEVASERGIKILKMMNGSVTRALELIENVLDFARGRLGGGLTLSRVANVPLKAVLEQVIDELRSLAPTQEIQITIDVRVPVDCDPVRIGQLASNLLGNALTHGAKDLPVRLTCLAVDSDLYLSVANGGAAIPPEKLESLFRPFFRGRDSREGLGLGLYIASEIAHAHGGELKAKSTELETEFSFTMPLIA